MVWTNSGTVALTDSRGNSYTSVGGADQMEQQHLERPGFLRQERQRRREHRHRHVQQRHQLLGEFLYIHEYSGMDKVAPLDVSSSAAGSSSAMNSGSVTTTNANDLIFGAGSSSNTVTQAGAGFTTRSTAYANRTQDRNVTATGSYNATATQNSFAWVMHMAAFKADPGTR